MSRKESGRTPQLAIKHLHHVVRWEHKRKKDRGERHRYKGKGMPTKEMKTDMENRKERAGQRKKQTERVKLRKHRDNERVKASDRQREDNS